MKFPASIHCLGLFICLTGCNTDSKMELLTEEGTTTKTDQATQTVDILQITDQLVDASCGQCQFGMEGNGCDLAIRIDGQSYFVDGTSIDDHGDAHADDGLCNCIRKAKATGAVKNGRFLATRLDVLPDDSAKKDGCD